MASLISTRREIRGTTALGWTYLNKRFATSAASLKRVILFGGLRQSIVRICAVASHDTKTNILRGYLICPGSISRPLHLLIPYMFPKSCAQRLPRYEGLQLKNTLETPVLPPGRGPPSAF